MHWPTAFKYVPFDPNVRGFPMDYEPDQCSKVRSHGLAAGRAACRQAFALTLALSLSFPGDWRALEGLRWAVAAAAP